VTLGRVRESLSEGLGARSLLSFSPFEEEHQLLLPALLLLLRRSFRPPLRSVQRERALAVSPLRPFPKMARRALSAVPLAAAAAAVASLVLSSLVLSCSAMNADDAGPQEGSTSLFAVFALSMLSLFVFPYTISKVVKAASPERESRLWEKVWRRKN